MKKVEEKAAAKKTAKKAPANQRQMSLMEAAIQVMRSVKQPMKAKDIYEHVAKKGLWSSPAGKTPVATLAAAIARDVASEKPRWRRTGPGLFTLTRKK